MNSDLIPMVNQIYNEDCLDCMKRIPDRSIDMILCDLPYGITRNEWDNIIPFIPLWEQYLRIIKDNGAIVLFASGIFESKLILSCEKYYRYKLVWVKSRVTGFLNANRMPLKKHEDICIFYKKLPTYNPQKKAGKPYKQHKRGQTTNYGKFNLTVNMDNKEYRSFRYPKDVIYFKTAENEGNQFHPTQKPIELGRYLIKTYSNPGDVVLDNACGSGSFLVSAILEGRNFIGIELFETLPHIRRSVNCVEVSKARIFQAWKSLEKEKKKTILKQNIILEMIGNE